MNKRIIRYLMLIGASMCMSFPILANDTVNPQQDSITLYVENKLIETPLAAPVSIDGRILVPSREVFEAIGAEIEYKDLEKKVYILYNDMLVVLEIDNTEVWMNGEILSLDVPAKIINGKLMIPVRFVSEQFGFKVSWSQEDKSVSIISSSLEEIILNEPIESIEDDISKEDVLVENSTIPQIPTEIEEVPEPEEVVEAETPVSQEGKVTYINHGEYQTIAIPKKNGISKNNIHVDDMYMNRKISIEFDQMYTDLLTDNKITVNDGVISEISVSNTDKTRIDITEQIIRSFKVTENESQILITLKKPSDQYEKLIVLDAGHGGSDSGAVGIENIYEKDLNLIFLKNTIASLNSKYPNIKVYVTRSTDIYHTLNNRALLANEIGADMFISIHANSATPSASGSEVLYFPLETPNNPSKILAESIQDKLANVLGMKDRGVKARADLYVLKNTNMPAALIEVGFVTNEADVQAMTNPVFQTKVGEQVAISIQEMFDAVTLR